MVQNLSKFAILILHESYHYDRFHYLPSAGPRIIRTLLYLVDLSLLLPEEDD